LIHFLLIESRGAKGPTESQPPCHYLHLMKFFSKLTARPKNGPFTVSFTLDSPFTCALFSLRVHKACILRANGNGQESKRPLLPFSTKSQTQVASLESKGMKRCLWKGTNWSARLITQHNQTAESAFLKRDTQCQQVDKARLKFYLRPYSLLPAQIPLFINTFSA